MGLIAAAEERCAFYAGALQQMPEHWLYELRRLAYREMLAGHAAVAGGLGIDVPVLTLLSSRTLFLTRWTDEMREVDTVIDVTTVASRAVKLGRVVTVTHLPGAVHDVFLSAPAVRARAFADIETWLGAYL
jgi:alpha-beta hydrolase superfamily lysophospholipase